MNYDVVVVGAGPAGLMAARKVASRGFSVLVLEKEKDLGVKACAEAVSASAFETAEIPVTQSLISNSINGAYVYPPDESKGVKISGSSYRGYILNKPQFLYALASEAVSSGSELMMRSEVKAVKMKGTTAESLVYSHKGETREVSFKYLVGADGVGSIVGRSCGFDAADFEIIPTIQYVMVNCKVPEKDFIRIYMGKEVAPLGYAWIFAKNEYVANVGIGVRGAPAKPYLDRFIEAHPEIFKGAKAIKEGGGAVPVGGQIKETSKGNVLLCGDAAGQVIPITGGGIRTSMGAGSIAGRCIADALESGRPEEIRKYSGAYSEYWGTRISRSLKVLRAIENLSDEDLNLLGSVLSGEDIVDLANGLDVMRVVAKFSRHPVLAMKIASKLL
ncbi:MAG: NAD(P)/FAD-dependent oxidoreductase [Candidatus Verstraetearchaeota archaeon]|nr:NAD(P)/FAD-dependent oxidoreductase [Candidatus Verstraetearchaeota archaeon]